LYSFLGEHIGLDCRLLKEIGIHNRFERGTIFLIMLRLTAVWNLMSVFAWVVRKSKMESKMNKIKSEEA